MESYSPDFYDQVLDQLNSCNNISYGTYRLIDTLMNEKDEQIRFGRPMIWIGIYIAVATLFCILPMLADLLHGFKAKKLWFPCKYFTVNAATLSVIAVAMKLPMDLNNPMPGVADQMAKFVSMAFMITMMAHLLPSIASMNNKELLTNTVALGVLVITMVVNVCIQLQTGILGVYYLPILVIIDVVMLLLMLIIYTSSALTILKSKQILESKYQACHEKALYEQPPGRSTVEKLKQHVNNHWIMVGTGSPQFMVACFATNSAAGVICATVTALHVTFMIFNKTLIWDCQSDYKWSTSAILIMQFIGILTGTIAPISRCFASLNLKFSTKWIFSHIKVFRVETYYTHKLYNWKASSMPLLFKSRRCKIVIDNLKVLILTFCIGLQMVIVIACKLVSFIPILLLICVLYCWKWLKLMFSALGFVLEKEPEQSQRNKDLSQYVLQLRDDVELADRTLKAISKSGKHLMQKAEKQQPTDLMMLLEGSSGFEGIRMYDMHRVPPTISDECYDCWSLAVVNMTAIAISLPNIQKDLVDKLSSGVSEGLAYATLVEESLNSTEHYVIILQKASQMLWLEVDAYYKWLGNNLQNIATQVNSVEQILEWFTDTAENLINEVQSTNTYFPNDNNVYRSVCASSMYRIAQTILLSYSANIDEVSQEELFMQLSSMISDILAACLTNLPQVIELKCNTNAIEKREASVHAAAQLLGQTMNIIDSLQDRELPKLSPAELPYFHKWRAYFTCPIP